jgi:hypothetical protein
MKDYGTQYGSVSPQPIEITATTVFVATDIKKISRAINDKSVEQYEYHLVQYDKDEYLLYQANRMKELEEELAAAKILLGVE